MKTHRNEEVQEAEEEVVHVSFSYAGLYNS